MLDERKTAILRAVVQEYVATGQPVGQPINENTFEEVSAAIAAAEKVKKVFAVTTPTQRAALLSAIASFNLCSVFPPPVFITRAIFFESRTSTIWGDPLLTLLMILHLILCFLKYSTQFSSNSSLLLKWCKTADWEISHLSAII